MSLFDLLFGERKPKTAGLAKERLQIILAHERSERSRAPDYLQALQRELIAVISKYVAVKPEDIEVKLEHQDSMDVLAVKIELTDSAR